MGDEADAVNDNEGMFEAKLELMQSFTKNKVLSARQKFDMIAPIAIWHFADCEFAREALIGFRKARKAGLLKAEHIDQTAGEVCDLYNRLFEEIVLEEKPDWVPVIDQYGAKGFRNEDGIVFTGDDSGFYPWYETAALILERVNQ